MPHSHPSPRHLHHHPHQINPSYYLSFSLWGGDGGDKIGVEGIEGAERLNGQLMPRLAILPSKNYLGGIDPPFISTISTPRQKRKSDQMLKWVEMGVERGFAGGDV
jgi:hypothetical protein